MTVSFYSVSGRSNEINKLDGVTGFSVDVTLYNDFNPAAPTFYLDRLRDANYCRFTYNGKIWVCSVSLVSFTDNIAVYSGSVDALATAWYNGCMDSLQLVQYSSDGNGSVMSDQRLPRYNVADRKKYINFFDQPAWNNMYAAVSVLRPSIGVDELHSAVTYDKNPMIETTFLRLNAPKNGKSVFQYFCENFYAKSDAEQTRYGNSIIRISLVPAEFAVTNVGITSTQFVTLYSISTGLWGSGETTLSIRLLAEGSQVMTDNAPISIACSVKHTYKTAINYPITPYTVDAKIEIYCQNIGVLSFTPGSIGLTDTITEIGYVAQHDFGAGVISAVLYINGVTYDHIFITTPYSYSVPIFTDTSITNWVSLISTGILSVAGIGVGIASAAVTGGATLPVVGAIVGGVGSAASFGGQVYAAETGSTSINGGYGGAPDIMFGRKNAVIISEHDPIDIAGYQALYGKPDGRRVKISTLSGYVQTLGARLPLNGLPYDIIQAAEGGLNAGAYII